MEQLPAIATRDLRKSYGDHLVLDGIDLEVPAGTVYALLGPNGSGKTTTVKILSTLLPPDAGTVRVAGHDVMAEADEDERTGRRPVLVSGCTGPSGGRGGPR